MFGFVRYIKLTTLNRQLSVHVKLFLYRIRIIS